MQLASIQEEDDSERLNLEIAGGSSLLEKHDKLISNLENPNIIPE